MLDAFKLIAILIASVLWGAWLVLLLRERDVHPLRDTLDRFGRLGWMKKVGVLFLVVQMTMFGGAKHGGTNDVDGVTGTNEVEIVGGGGQSNLTSCAFGLEVGEAAFSPLQQRMSSPLKSGETPLPRTDVLSDFTRGYRLESVLTNEDYSYAMPADGAIRGTWHLTGAYEDVQRIGLESLGGLERAPFKFPLDNNLCSSLWAYTWGKVRPQLKNATNEIAAVGAPMSAIPEVSRFWTMATTNDTYLLTWENFAAGRVSGEAVSSPLQNGIDPPLTSGETPLPLVSAQIELFRNGDFITRSNNVECVYRRVNPDDWDDDGIPNEVDEDPLAGSEELQFGPHQTLLEGHETNYLYWVDLVVRQANARVVFEGDGVSDFADPTFIAKAGETNRVYLLIGKTYSVSCPMPLECVGKEDEEVEISPSGNGLSICWDIRLEFVRAMPLQTGPSLLGAAADDGETRVQIHPGRAGGGSFSWPGSFCCYNYDADGAPVFNCHGNCGCIGYCHTGAITYTYVGYSRDFDGWTCSCTPSGDEEDPDGGDDDPENPPTVGCATVSFSKRAIIFEDEYEASEGVTVPRRSTESRLTCFAYGGESGGVATFEIEGDGRLVTVSGRTLPFTQRVGPNEDYEVEIVYQGKRGSGGRVRVTASFASNDPDERTSDCVANLDVVEIEIMCQVLAPANDSCYRHKFGVGEKINCNHYPSEANLQWTSTTGSAVSETGEFVCPFLAASNPLTAVCGDAAFTPNIQVVEPVGIEARNPSCRSYGVGAGRAGWVGLRLEFYVMPFDVSFGGIRMEEVPSTIGYRSGYFNRPSFSVIGCHSREMGAGNWVGVGEDNKMGDHDDTRLTVELMRIDASGEFTDNPSFGWEDGWVSWAVPFGWTTPAAVLASAVAAPIGRFDPNAAHRFEITASGLVTVRKFGNYVQRDVDGHMNCNGIPCGGNE